MRKTGKGGAKGAQEQMEDKGKEPGIKSTKRGKVLGSKGQASKKSKLDDASGKKPDEEKSSRNKSGDRGHQSSTEEEHDESEAEEGVRRDEDDVEGDEEEEGECDEEDDEEEEEGEGITKFNMEQINPNPLVNYMHVALNNPLILQNIFDKCENNRKGLRLVCKCWNELLLSLAEPAFDLNLNPYEQRIICCCPKQLHMFCFTSDPRLARSIQLDSSGCPENRHSIQISTAAIDSKLLHFMDKFSTYLQHVNFSVSNACIPTLLYIFQNSCPNLKHIGLTLSKHADETDEEQLLKMSPLECRPKLESMCFSKSYSGTPDIYVQQLAQLLISSAPNLDILDISYHFYADLSRNPKLRILMIDHLPGHNLDGLLRMLNQVAGHIQVLKLHEDDCNAEGNPEFMFKLPVMPQLKCLTNALLDVLPLGESLQDIAQCKSLRSITISNSCNRYQKLDSLLENMSTAKGVSSNCVTSLSILQVGDHKLLRNLKMPFPWLNYLQVTSYYENGYKLELGPTLEACSALGLQHLRLYCLLYPNKVSRMISCFANNREWIKSLKTLTISGCASQPDDDVTECEIEIFKRCLISMNGVKDARIYSMFGVERTISLERYILENKLPVKITDNATV